MAVSRGLVHLAKYLLEHYVELDYILLGKIQSDRVTALKPILVISENFGGVSQFIENEAMVRIRSRIWWSRYSAHQVSSAMAPIRQEQDQDALKVVEELRVIMYPMEYNELENSLKSSLGHIAGYLARSATRGSKCGSCADILVDKDSPKMIVNIEVDELECEAIYRSCTELLERGKLLAPSTI